MYIFEIVTQSRDYGYAPDPYSGNERNARPNNPVMVTADRYEVLSTQNMITYVNFYIGDEVIHTLFMLPQSIRRVGEAPLE